MWANCAQAAALLVCLAVPCRAATTTTRSAPLVASYAEAIAAVELHAPDRAVLDALNALRGKDGLATLTLSPALCLAAKAHSAQFPEDEPPDPFPDGLGSVSYWAAAAGVSTVFLRGACTTATTETDPADLAKALHQALDAKHMTLVGLGRSTGKGFARITVIAARPYVALSPAPMQPGQALELRGRLDKTLKGCFVTVTGPDGKTRRAHTAAGPELDARLSLGDAPGEYRVEIVGLADRGPMLTDVLRFHRASAYPRPFAQQPPPPRAAKPPGPAQTAAPTTTQDIVQALVDGINRERTSRAIQPLAVHAKLAQIAEYNSKELRRRETLKPDGKLVDIYIKSQVRFKAYNTAFFVGPRPPKPQDMKLTHNRFFTHIGVGIAKGELKGKETLWGTIILMAQ